MKSVPQLQSQRVAVARKTQHENEIHTDIAGRASLLENEIGHIGKVWGHNRVKPRIMPHRTERCERELLTHVVDGYDLTIRKDQRDEHAFREAGVCQGVRTQQLQEEVACACTCTKTQQRKTAR